MLRNIYLSQSWNKLCPQLLFMLVVVVVEMVVILLKHSELYEYNCDGSEGWGKGGCNDNNGCNVCDNERWLRWWWFGIRGGGRDDDLTNVKKHEEVQWTERSDKDK